MHGTGAWCVMFLLAATGSASAQATSGSRANDGAITVTGGVDAPTLYLVRGIVQEGEPQLTLMPRGDLGIALRSDGNETAGSLRVNVGVLHSLNTGSSGSGGPLDALHYAEQFYATMTVGVGHGITITPGYLANTSPNGGYDTIGEVNVRVAGPRRRLSPYGMVAIELSHEGQLDEGSKKGAYVEMGATPTFGAPFLKARLALPVRAGFSLGDYYELFERNLRYRDHRFGFFEVGGVVSVPLTSVGSGFGDWDLHGGAHVLALGETTKAFNRGAASKVVATLGLGLTY